MAKVLKVAVSVPNEAFVSPEAYENHIVLAAHQGRLETKWEYEKRNPRYEFYRFTTGRLLTPMAREKLINVAMEGEMDYIVMMDNDMLYPIDFLERMLEDVEKHPEIDILAPLAFMRSPPHCAVMYTLLDGYDSTTHSEYYINQFVKNYPKDKLVECDAVGFGAVLIKMDIFKKMNAPYCFSTTGSGEDIYLCYKAKKEAKARIFMDTRIKLGHMGQNIIIDEDYREKYAKEHGEEIVDVPHKYIAYDR
jgi:hypothetical protein